MSITEATIKRLGRTLLGGTIMGGLLTLFGFLETTPFGIFILPIGTAIINAAGKMIREKWSVRVPF